jgi:hypothetical protein
MIWSYLIIIVNCAYDAYLMPPYKSMQEYYHVVCVTIDGVWIGELI